MKVLKNMLFICIIGLLTIALSGCSKTNAQSKAAEQSFESYESVFKNGDRIFATEVTPKSQAERVIADCLKVEISDKYDDFKNLYYDNEVFSNFPEVYKSKFNDGEYAEKITIHSMRELSEQEYAGKSEANTFFYNIDRLKSSNVYKFKIVEVDFTIKYTEKQNKIAQWGNGDWTRYYVVVLQDEKSTWKIFEIYW